VNLLVFLTLFICHFFQDACVFVSGASKRMPADVRNAILNVLQEHLGMSSEEGDAYLLKLARQKRYLVESW
jgi:sulfite reductase alpha subunit-like flavoprotein